MDQPALKPDRRTLEKVEELLRQELTLLGVDTGHLAPHEISANMRCGVHENGRLSYVWQGIPILDVVPERQADGAVVWRIYTQEQTMQ